jgi:hypothetical protein
LDKPIGWEYCRFLEDGFEVSVSESTAGVLMGVLGKYPKDTRVVIVDYEGDDCEVVRINYCGGELRLK